MSAAFAGAAPASYAAGLTNPGFEAGLSDWTPTRLAYNPETEAFGEPAPAVCARPEGICAVTTDTFQVTETDEQGNETTRDVTVQPLEGTQMARIGGPFTSSEQTQSQDRYRLEQRFTVDPAAPALALNYNVFTFDYQGFDEVRFTVSLADAEGDVILAQEQGAFGPSGDTSLKTTGWTSAGIDLTGYEGQELRLRIELAGTKDQLYGFWAYIDAGLAPEPPVGRPGWSGPATTPSGEAVDVDVECNPQTDECWILIPTSQAAEFEGGCLGPITLNIPLNPGTGTVSDFELILETGGPAGTERFAGSDSDNNNVWAVEIPCFQEGDLWLSYRLTEGGESQTFLIPYGGLVLIDPAGIVHDKARYDAAIASGQTREQALASSAIEAATVRLQRLVDGTWRNVLSGDPGIAPNVNPQITEADGRYAWDTVEGTYRVVVSKEGYETATSREVTVPPEVTDLHVPLLRPDADGDGVPDTSDACPNEAATTANGCPPPDADGDGVPDTSDACPNAAARTANGCPPPTEAPAVTPPSLPQALDTIGPAVALFRGSIVATKGVVPYRVTCARGERICQGTVKLTAPKQKGIRSTKLGTTTFQAPGGKTAVAKIVLSTKNRKLLARHKRLRVVAEVVARDQAGNATIKRQAFTLKAPRK